MFFQASLVHVTAEGLDLSNAGRVVERIEAISDGSDVDERG